MAIWVQEEQIGEFVRASMNTIVDVMDIPPRFFRDFLLADRTVSVLLFPEVDEPSPLGSLKPFHL